MTGVPSPKLVTCTACGGIVSRRAPRCPHCGEEWPGRQAEVQASARHGGGLANWQIGLIVATVIAVVAGSMVLGRGGRDFILRDGPLADLLEGTEPIGAFGLGETWDDFEMRGRPYGIARTADDGPDAGLGWVCLDDGLNVVLYLGRYFGGDGDHDIEVRHRFDAGRPSGTEYWHLFGDNTSAYRSLDAVHDFTARALDADSVTVRATDPYDGEQLTVTFGLDGLDALLQRLHDCAADADSAAHRVPDVDGR